MSSVEGSALAEADLILEKDSAIVEENDINGSSESISSPVIYTVSELADNPQVLHEVVSVINSAFKAKDETFGSGLRFPKDEDLVQQSGKDALCSVIRAGEKVVATASIQRWREPKGSAADAKLKDHRPDDYALVEAGRSYEVKAVATMVNPAFRQKGLAVRSVAKLEEEILQRTGGEFMLWIHTAEHQNGPYWRRRGFENVLIETKPIGYWGAYQPFEFVTGVKRVTQQTKLVYSDGPSTSRMLESC